MTQSTLADNPPISSPHPHINEPLNPSERYIVGDYLRKATSLMSRLDQMRLEMDPQAKIRKRHSPVPEENVPYREVLPITFYLIRDLGYVCAQASDPSSKVHKSSLKLISSGSRLRDEFIRTHHEHQIETQGAPINYEMWMRRTFHNYGREATLQLGDQLSRLENNVMLDRTDFFKSNGGRVRATCYAVSDHLKYYHAKLWPNHEFDGCQYCQMESRSGKNDFLTRLNAAAESVSSKIDKITATAEEVKDISVKVLKVGGAITVLSTGTGLGFRACSDDKEPGPVTRPASEIVQEIRMSAGKSPPEQEIIVEPALD